jgi:hypothetical protein
VFLCFYEFCFCFSVKNCFSYNITAKIFSITYFFRAHFSLRVEMIALAFDSFYLFYFYRKMSTSSDYEEQSLSDDDDNDEEPSVKKVKFESNDDDDKKIVTKPKKQKRKTHLSPHDDVYTTDLFTMQVCWVYFCFLLHFHSIIIFFLFQKTEFFNEECSNVRQENVFALGERIVEILQSCKKWNKSYEVCWFYYLKFMSFSVVRQIVVNKSKHRMPIRIRREESIKCNEITFYISTTNACALTPIEFTLWWTSADSCWCWMWNAQC